MLLHLSDKIISWKEELLYQLCGFYFMLRFVSLTGFFSCHIKKNNLSVSFLTRAFSYKSDNIFGFNVALQNKLFVFISEDHTESITRCIQALSKKL